MSWHNKAVAITGSIGSGKSTVCNILESLGAYVVSADKLASKSLAKSTVAIVEAFGGEVVDEEGRIIRSKLASLVFGDSEKKALLEGIIHPQVALLAEEAFSLAPESASLLVYDVPLLFESNLKEKSFLATVCVIADEDKIIDRLQSDRSMSQEEIKQRLNSQLPQQDKISYSDYVIENNSSLSDLEQSVAWLFSELRDLQHKSVKK